MKFSDSWDMIWKMYFVLCSARHVEVGVVLERDAAEQERHDTWDGLTWCKTFERVRV